MNNRILIVVTKNLELNSFLSKLNYNIDIVLGYPVYKASIGNNQTYIIKANLGKVNAAILCSLMIEKIKPKYVIGSGIAKGLNPNLNIGDIVISTKLAYCDLDFTSIGYNKGQIDDFTCFFKASKKLVDLANNDCNFGLIVSADQIIQDINKLNDIKLDFPKALALDNEGCAIAHTAFSLSKKFIIIRCISDNPFNKTSQNDNENNISFSLEKVVKVTLDLINKIS